MTRINLIPPSDLHRKHLQAEYYELPEIFRLVSYRQMRNHTPKDCAIPETYCFGTGHKTFFYNKLLWLEKRYNSLAKELISRGYNMSPMGLKARYCTLASHWWNDWTPSEAEIKLSYDRIKQREQELGL